MAELNIAAKLEKQAFTSEVTKDNLDRNHELFLQDNIRALQGIKEDLVNLDVIDSDFVNLDTGHVYFDAAEEADDEMEDDDDFVEILPLNIKKAKTGKDSDQVHLSTTHTEQNTQNTTDTHHRVEWADNLAQAQKNSAEASHTVPTASGHTLTRAPTPYPKPCSAQPISDLLHPSPPLRRHKGSMSLRKNTPKSATARSRVSEIGEDHDAFYGHHQDRAAKNSDAYSTPTRRGKMPEARGNQNDFYGEDKGNAAETPQTSETSTSSGNPALKPKTSGSKKADVVLGYGEEDESTPEKSMTGLVTTPKANQEKKSLRNFFHRKGSKESITPPSSSGKTAGRMTISGPTLIDASPNAKALLNSASSLVDASPNAKNVVNYSRPIVPQSPSDASNGSPVVRGRSSSSLPGPKPLLGPSASLEDLSDKSGNITVGLNASLMHDRSDASAVRENQAAREHRASHKTLAAEKNQDASDSGSIRSSDYSGDENSVQTARPVEIVFSGRAKLVDVRPPRGANTTALGHQSGVRIANAPGTGKMTDREAEVLGAMDADRYSRTAMNSQTHGATTTTEDPFIDPAYRNLLAKPANEIAAKEMARIKAAREAGKTGGDLMERMNALLAKSEGKPAVQNTGVAYAGPRTNAGETLLTKMRGLKMKPKKEEEQKDNEEEVAPQVKAEEESGLQKEKEINKMIKAKLAAKDAANGGVRGAGIPRIDYGPPNLGTTLGASAPTDAERADARTLAVRHAADLAERRAQSNKDNTTARGQFEGC